MVENTAGDGDYARWVLRGISYLQLSAAGAAFELPELPARIGYTVQSGFALIPGPPLAPYAQWTGATQGFEAYTRDVRLTPAFCGVSELGKAFLTQRDYRTLKLGDEALVPLDTLTLEGAPWAEVRAALNRAHRRDISFSWLDTDARVRCEHELRAVAADWQRRKPLRELRFGLGGIDAAFDPHCRLAVALNNAGDVVALTSWSPMPLRNGWMLDVVRYRPGVMAGLMDALIASSMLAFRAEGAAVVSLGGVPGSNVMGATGGWLRVLLDWAAGVVHWPYNPAGLLHFKAKFNPRWEPLYLAVPPSASMAAALTAVVRAVLPAAPWERSDSAKA